YSTAKHAKTVQGHEFKVEMKLHPKTWNPSSKRYAGIQVGISFGNGYVQAFDGAEVTCVHGLEECELVYILKDPIIDDVDFQKKRHPRGRFAYSFQGLVTEVRLYV